MKGGGGIKYTQNFDHVVYGWPPITNQDSIRSQYEICGIVSWGKGCLKSKKEYPGVYTNVSKYLDWIKSNL